MDEDPSNDNSISSSKVKDTVVKKCKLGSTPHRERDLSSLGVNKERGK